MATVDPDIKAAPEAAIMPEGTKYGTFAGVFTPTLLTILGVIMYLRTGWVVGNAGIVGGLLIILMGFGIVLATGLSMSSITTNIRIGAGGAYSIISQSLGLEVGGSVGIPLYLSQALAVTMYLFGFREGWMWVFPGHSALLVDLIAFALVFGIAYASAGLAFRVQYGILAIIVASLISVAVAAYTGSMIIPLGGTSPAPRRMALAGRHSGWCLPCSSPPPRGSWLAPTCPASWTTRVGASR